MTLLKLFQQRVAFGVGVFALLITAIGFTTPPAAATPMHAVSQAHDVVTLPAGLAPAVAQTFAQHMSAAWQATRTGYGAGFNNPAQHLTLHADDHGVQLMMNPQVAVRLQLVRYTQGTVRAAFHQPMALHLHGTEVSLSHGAGLTEWYINSPLGIEQGVTLARPLTQATAVTLRFQLQTALNPVMKNGTLVFNDYAGNPRLHYGNLLAFDAGHRTLPTRLLLAGNHLTLAVDTRGARYPVTVDPLFTTIIAFADPAATAEDEFGVSVALDAAGTTALIGATGTSVNGQNAGAAYVYTQTDGVWSTAPTASFADPAATFGDEFGSGVALDATGSTALVSAWNTTGGGAAYVYTQTDGIWSTSPTASFTDPAATANDDFGFRVALGADGSTALIGAPFTSVGGQFNDGAAYVYTQTDGIWSTAPTASFADPTTTSSANFGESVALDAAGTTALITAQGTASFAGAVYVYTETSGVWSTRPTASFADPAATTNDSFGTGVALDAAGTTALIGCVCRMSSSNRVYVYTETSGRWSTTPKTVIVGPKGSIAFGTSVGLNAAGTIALIGAWDTTSQAGAAYAYTETHGVWSTSPTTKFTDTGIGDSFGFSVSLDAAGSTALIGAWGTADQAGAAYVSTSLVNLALALSSSPSRIMLGGNVTYPLTLSNNDTQATATSLTLTDTLPAGMAFVATNASGGSCSGSSTVTCTLPSLAPGATWQPSITVLATAAGSFNDTATVSADQAATTPADESANVTTTVIGLPPTVSNGSVSTTADQTVNGTLAGSNPCTCGTPVFGVVSQPNHGSVTLTDTTTGAFSYMPTTGFVGSDSFTFELANGQRTSTAATESVAVNDVAPTAHNGSVNARANQAVRNALSATAAYNGQALRYELLTPPTHGAAGLINALTGTFRYTPATGFSGIDSFTFNVKDGAGTPSNTATESVTVKDVAPTANNGTLNTTVDTATGGTLSATAAYRGQTLTYQLVTQPGHGTVMLSSRLAPQPGQGTVTLTNASTHAFTYTPAPGFLGSDRFTFDVEGSAGALSNTATESVTVNDLAATAQARSYTIEMDHAFSSNVSSTKAYSGQTLTYGIVSPPAHGTVRITDSTTGAFTYIPANGFVGHDGFTFNVTDAYGSVSNTANDSFTIKDVVARQYPP